jgi:hypothetical protein
MKEFKYKCLNCGGRNNLPWWKLFFIPHFSSFRYFKCKHCKKITWHKKLPSTYLDCHECLIEEEYCEGSNFGGCEKGIRK